MKLSIKHIAPYLPYGLKVQTSWSIDGFGGLCTSKAIGLYRDELLLEPYTILHKHIPYRISIDRTSLSDPDTKPLLLPMSSLYTEMEDGTVPIVELARIAVDYEWVLGKHYCDGLYIDAAESIYDIFYYNESHKVFELANIYGIGGVAPNQLDLFTYLFSNHFDVFSLIDKGLAIDKTKIK